MDNEEFEKYYFYVTDGVGVAAILSGVITPMPFLGMGFILGGVFCLVAAYFKYWDELNDWVKFASLIFALIILILGSFKFVRVGKK